VTIAARGRTVVCAAIVAALTALLSRATNAQDRRLWGTLKPGAYSVGFTRSWQLDYARQYAPPFRIEGASPKPESPRPILINLWYPAKKTDAAPMRYREYLEIGCDNPLIAAFARRLEAFTRQTIAEEVLEERPAKIDQVEAAGIERMLDAITFAVKDAPAAPAKFPLIIGHPGLGGTFEDNSVFYEYLASYGYVVAVAAYQSEDASYLNVDWDLDRSVKEMDFLIRFAKARPEFDLGPIGAIGHSYGAQAVLAWRAENNSPLSAVVSLDSTVEYSDPQGPDFARLKPRLASAFRLAGPILLYASKDGEPRFKDHWRHLKYTRLYTAAVPFVEHIDFISQGATRFAFLPGRTNPPEKGADIRAQYDLVCLCTRTFFDAYLKGDPEAEAFLKRRASNDQSKLQAEFGLTLREPAPVPPTAGQLCELAHKQGLDAAIQLVRRFGTEMAEETLGNTAVGLALDGKSAEAVALNRLWCELYPSSWNAQRALGERLLDEDDHAGATTAYRKAQALIAAGAKPPASERARKLIANGLKKAEGK
jgi:dienelactone hydrolase